MTRVDRTGSGFPRAVALALGVVTVAALWLPTTTSAGGKQVPGDRALENTQLAKSQGQAELGLAEVALRLAELELKKSAGQDPDQKQVLQLKVRQAQPLLERARTLARVKEIQAETDLRAREAAL